MSSSEQGVNPPAKQEKKANPVLEQWRVTIQRVRPQLIGLLVLVIGIVVGLFWGYSIAPTVWTSAEPVHLHTSYQEEWVKMAADQYALFGPQVESTTADMLAQIGNSQAIIDSLIQQNGSDRELIGRLQAIRPLASGADNPELQKLAVSGLAAMNPIVLIVIIVVVGALAIILWGMYAMAVSMIVKGLLPSRRKSGADGVTSETSQREAERRRIAQEAAQQRQTAPVAEAGPPPVARFVSSYLTGDDYYDDSFSIEDESGGFLGETGAGISETIGVGAPKKVAAVEVWLFDKNDIRTVTKVVMTEHAYNDEAIRAKLAPKGEAVMARPGMPVELETQTLRIVATIQNLKFGDDPSMPPNSYFDNLTFDMAAYAKEGATSAPGTAIGDMYGGGAAPPPAMA